VCDDPATTKPKHWRLFRLFQITNNQSILSPASAGPISQDETTSGLYILYPFSKISKLFLAALQVTEITASLTAQADRTNEQPPCTTTTHHYQRAQHKRQQQGQHDTGSSGLGCAVPTVLHLTYRAPALPNPNQSAARYGMYETNSYGQTTV
jgi:hypothetical protein